MSQVHNSSIGMDFLGECQVLWTRMMVMFLRQLTILRLLFAFCLAVFNCRVSTTSLGIYRLLLGQSLPFCTYPSPISLVQSIVRPPFPFRPPRSFRIQPRAFLSICLSVETHQGSRAIISHAR